MQKKSGKWHSVSLTSKSGCCAAATRLSSQRFLSHQVPRLPLDACDRPARCTCKYQHHTDRRDEPRRATDDGGPPQTLTPATERRSRRGRRNSDR